MENVLSSQEKSEENINEDSLETEDKFELSNINSENDPDSDIDENQKNEWNHLSAMFH